MKTKLFFVVLLSLSYVSLIAQTYDNSPINVRIETLADKIPSNGGKW